MNLAMTKSEREAFLADLHVGVLAVEQPDGPPVAAPVWYLFENGEVVLVTGAESVKGRALAASGRASLCAQTETAPYKYVSVEGPVTIEPGSDPDIRRTLAIRYLGPELAEGYLAMSEGDAATGITVRLRPERWRTVDYTKQFA